MEMSGPAFKRSTFEVNLENRDRDEREELLQGLGFNETSLGRKWDSRVFFSWLGILGLGVKLLLPECFFHSVARFRR